jgi:hypothetical protein
MSNPLQKLIAERDRLIKELDMTIDRIESEQKRCDRIDKSIREYEDAIDKLQMFDTMSVPGEGVHVQRTV